MTQPDSHQPNPNDPQNPGQASVPEDANAAGGQQSVPSANPWQGGQPVPQPNPSQPDPHAGTGHQQYGAAAESDQETQIHPAVGGGWQTANGPAQPADQWQTARQPDPASSAGHDQYGSAGHDQYGSAGHDQYGSAGQAPQGQPSAGYPQGQPSAGYPQQPYVGYPQGQDSAAGFGQQQPGAQAYPGWPQQPAPQPAQRKFGDANPLQAAFDFSFTRYATPGLVKIIYVLAVVIAAVWWIGGTITTFVLGAAVSDLGRMTTGSGGGGGGGIVLGIVTLLLGWIPALLWVLFVRVVLEAAMALVRVAEDARGIREKVAE